MCGGNRLIACSGEIERDGTAVFGKDRQSPAIAAKARTHCEFNAHVFHCAPAQMKKAPSGPLMGLRPDLVSVGVGRTIKAGTKFVAFRSFGSNWLCTCFRTALSLRGRR